MSNSAISCQILPNFVKCCQILSNHIESYPLLPTLSALSFLILFSCISSPFQSYPVQSYPVQSLSLFSSSQSFKTVFRRRVALATTRRLSILYMLSLSSSLSSLSPISAFTKEKKAKHLLKALLDCCLGCCLGCCSGCCLGCCLGCRLGCSLGCL